METEHKNRPDELGNRFEESLVFLKSSSEKYICHIGSGEVAIDLITAVVLWPNQGNVEMLLGRNKRYRYGFGDHEEIFAEHQLNDDSSRNFFAGYLIEFDQKKVVLVDGLRDSADALGDEALCRCMSKYRVEAIGTLAKGIIQNDEIGWDVTEFYLGNTDFIDEGLRSSICLKVAKVYNLTVGQWMRFRLNSELPQRRKYY